MWYSGSYVGKSSYLDYVLGSVFGGQKTSSASGASVFGGTGNEANVFGGKSASRYGNTLIFSLIVYQPPNKARIHCSDWL